MSFPNNNLNQTATYWANTGSNGFGWFTFSTPVQINCRWIDKQELILDKDGKESLSDAVVSVDQDMSLSDYLYLGTSAAADPKDVSGTYEIKKTKKTPNLKADKFRRRVWLKKR